MDETSVMAQAIFYTSFGSANIHVFNFGAFGEVFHDSGAVEDGVNLNSFKQRCEVVGHVASYYIQTLADDFFKCRIKVIE